MEEEKKTWKQFSKDIAWSMLSYAVASAIGATAAILGIHPQKIIEREVQIVFNSTIVTNDGQPRAMGWTADPAVIDKIVKGLKYPVFAKTPAGSIAEAELPDKVFLWELTKAAWNKYIPTRDQKQVGSCVSFGTTTAIEYLQASQAVAMMKIGIPPPDFKDLAQEFIYGTSRVQVGGGGLRGSDGSIGGWAATAAKDYGSVPRGVYGSGIDLTEYNEKRCRRYGDDGPPKELFPVAKQYIVKAVSPIKTTDDLKRSLANYYPVAICSSVGFGNSSPYIRDNDGVLAPRGSWAHCMVCLGYIKHPTRGHLYFIMNSWSSSWIGGPKGAGDPPEGGFYVTETIVQRMLNAEDSWSFSNLTGFEVQVLDWLIMKPLPRNRLFDLFVVIK